MIEAYKIAVNMTLKGDANKKMIEFSKLTEKAAKSLMAVQKVIKSFNMSLKNINKELSKANPALDKFLRSISSFGVDLRVVNRSMNFFNESLIGVEGNTSRLRYQTDTLRNSMRSLAHASREARAGINSVGRTRMRGGGAGSNGVHGGGALRSGLVGTVAGAAARFAAPAAIGYGAIKMGTSAFHAGEEYNRGLANIRGMGYSSGVVNSANSYAMSSTPGVSPQTKLESYRTALMATQSPAMAGKLAPILTAGGMAAQRMYGGSFTQHQYEEAIRTAESMGGDDNKIAQSLSNVFRMTSLSGGTLLPGSIRQFVNRNASISPMGLLAIEPSMQELKGDKLGTGIRTGLGAFMKGNVPSSQAKSWQSYGWTGDVRYDKHGNREGSKYGDFKQNLIDLYSHDPQKFLTDVILPTYKKRGWDKENDINRHLVFDLPRTTADVFINMNKNLRKSQEIRSRAEQIPGISGLSQMGAPESKSMQNLSESMKTFSKALSELTDPAVTAGMDLISRFLMLIARVITSRNDVPTIDRSNPLNWFGKGSSAVTNTSSGVSSSKNSGNVYLDAKRVGNILWGQTPNQMVNHGTTALIPSLSGMPPAVNYTGGGQS